MCGIAGISSAALSPDKREERVRAMVGRQHHRGPDDQGMHSAPGVTLGMARLAIIDPAGGHQPMRTDRHVLVFNGAIYNYRELRQELTATGWQFRSDCDTEVLLAAYARFGPACLHRLRGMFAFAVWDTQEHTLFAARDGLGIKPLYYGRLPEGGIAFASELNALLASGLFAREVDPAAVGEYLARFAIPPPRTLYQGISNLAPGHSLRVDAAGRVAVHRWWHLPPPLRETTVPLRYSDFVAGLRHQLEDTIRAHRIADVPVGAFLSGGLDSSTVVALMSRTGAERLKTFSVVFDESTYSEHESARLAARAIGTEHHEFRLTGRRLADDLPRIIATFDQPTGDGINTYYASLAAREGGVTVALSGLGGDELFGGYPSFTQLPRLARLVPWWRRLPRPVQRQTIAALRRQHDTRLLKLADFLDFGRDLHELASLQRRVLPEPSRLALLSPDARAAAARLGPHYPHLDDFVGDLLGADPFQIISAWELRTYMADVLLRDSDVFSMAHSLELRVPFVDTVLLDWLWPQSARFKFRPGESKRALADAVRDLLPDAIRHRQKWGFSLPYARWMRGELRPFLDEIFSDASLARCPFLDAPAVARLWSDYLVRGDSRAWSRVWTVAMLIAIANRPAPPPAA